MALYCNIVMMLTDGGSISEAFPHSGTLSVNTELSKRYNELCKELQSGAKFIKFQNQLINTHGIQRVLKDKIPYEA